MGCQGPSHWSRGPLLVGDLVVRVSWFWGLGFRGLGFRVYGFGIDLQLRLWGWDAEPMASGLELGVKDAGFMQKAQDILGVGASVNGHMLSFYTPPRR